MNRVALLVLMVATLVGCSGGSKSAPDPGPVVPTPMPGGVARQSEQDVAVGGSGAISSNSLVAGAESKAVDWIEHLSPPFQRGQTEFFLVHLGRPAEQLTWNTASRGFLTDVRSDREGAHHSTDNSDTQGPIYRSWINNAGQELRCKPWTYEEAVIQCQIRRDGIDSFVTSTFTPRHVPPPAGAPLLKGVVGTTGEEYRWQSGVESAANDIRWDFGGGASPNTAQGPGPASTILSAPGRYTATYTVRNAWGFSGPQEVGYWVRPTLSTHSLNSGYATNPTMLLFNNRIRVLFQGSDDVYRYAAAQVSEPKSSLDWQIHTLPMPELKPAFMQMGVHRGSLLIVGGRHLNSDTSIVPYWRAATQAPRGPEDWDVGGIPHTEGLHVLDIEIGTDRVGLIGLENDNLVLWWDSSPALSDWHSTTIVDHPAETRLAANRLFLSDFGPAVIGTNLRSAEPVGLLYRDTTWNAPAVWAHHLIVEIKTSNSYQQRFAACTYQGRPLVLGCPSKQSAILLWSQVQRPTATAHWERQLTCQELTPIEQGSSVSIDARGDRVVMSGVDVLNTHENGSERFDDGGLLLQGDLSDLAHWTPFSFPAGTAYEPVRATVVMDDGVGLLTYRFGLHFGMFSP